MQRLVRIVVATAVLVLLALPSAAQYPTKPVRIIVPFPAGTPTDIIARAIAQPLSQALGQPVLIDNRAGAEGVVAGIAVVNSAPDGYTLFLATTSIVGVPALRKNPPFDPLADFTPITSIGKFTFVLFIHTSIPAKSLAELIDYARAHPGKLNYAASNATARLAIAQVMSIAKLDMVYVPYKGDTLVFTDLMNGRVQITIGPPTIWLPQVKTGKLRALGTLLSRRSPLLPEVPTMAEAGIPGIPFVPWIALFGPAGMPKEIVERLNREVRTVLQRQDMREQMDKLAIESAGSSPDELAAYVKDQFYVWRSKAREVGIEPE